MSIGESEFASSSEEADARAERYADHDPLPSVPRSLLGSAEIHDYARLTGMLHPFYPKALKSASYEAHIGGQFIWWDENNKRHEEKLGYQSRCKLPPNSISFVQVEPEFRLPNYIAIRFNLRITHVHRGLLLGTGPLVDPGFAGKLLIPLHNLTSSEYVINTDEALIWIEFTKTTFGVIPTEPLASTVRHFKRFPEEKKDLTPDQYFLKANKGEPIRSSIPVALEEGKKDAEKAAEAANEAATAAKAAQSTANKIRTNSIYGAVVAVATLLVALTALGVQVHDIAQSSVALSSSVQNDLASLLAARDAAFEEAEQAKLEIELLRIEINEMSARIEAIGNLPPTERPPSEP